MALDVARVRAEFPALGSGAVFFDNPAGTQVPRRVIARMTDYMVDCNANGGGAFRTSRATDAVIGEARAAWCASAWRTTTLSRRSTA